ncbi:MAG: homogentisate 1,2-dioxygenase [Steroidobacteraceae bacterium]|nr:homogentisate 1,2-dioxygenase [Steroidobacteraceae bacterium]
MKRYIHFPKVEGQASRQAHADLPAGTYEREISKDGFFGPAAHLYHRHPPTSWVNFEGPLRPHAFDCTKLEQTQPSPWDAPELLCNASTRLRFWRCAAKMPALAQSPEMRTLVRNADGDELLFVHAGSGEFFCDYGHLSFAAGDYILIPRGTMWRVECTAPLAALLIEATNNSLRLPDKGLVGPHAIFDAAMLDTPRIDDAFREQQDGEWRVAIKRRNAISTVTYAFNPLDAVGWHGDLSVVRINVRDLRPLMSHRYHLPPSAHTTFLADRFVVCTFVPRPFETDPGAMKVPFFHNNDDYDEVIFYHAGNFFSRDNIHPGMITMHPGGFTHGPHPKALQNVFEQKKPATDEYAVMIDTRDALEIAPAAAGIEWPGYVDSWKGAK